MGYGSCGSSGTSSVDIVYTGSGTSTILSNIADTSASSYETTIKTVLLTNVSSGDIVTYSANYYGSYMIYAIS